MVPPPSHSFFEVEVLSTLSCGCPSRSLVLVPLPPFLCWYFPPLSVSSFGVVPLSSLSSWLFLPLLFVVSSSLFLRGGALSIFLSVWSRDEKAARTTNEREEEGKSRHYTERGLREPRQSRTKQRGRESTFVLPFCGDSMSPSLSMWWFLLYLSFFRGWFLTSLSLLMVSVSLFYVDERGTITTTRETERRRTEPPPPKNWSGDCPPLSSVSLSLLWWLHSSFFRWFFLICETAHIDLNTFVTGFHQ